MSQTTSESEGGMGGSAVSSWIGLGLAVLFIIGTLTSKTWFPWMEAAIAYAQRAY